MQKAQAGKSHCVRVTPHVLFVDMCVRPRNVLRAPATGFHPAAVAGVSLQ